MSRSVSAPKPPRAQRLCTLWTHDDNFSREEVVFNSEKFQELPTAPGTLLQIVAFNDDVSARDHNDTHGKGGTSREFTSEHHLHRVRRGSMTAQADNTGSSLPGNGHLDADKAYVFMPKALPADLRTKHPNLQVRNTEPCWY